MDSVSARGQSVRAERPAFAGEIVSVKFAFCFRARPEVFFVDDRGGMAFFANRQRGKTVQFIFCHGITSFKAIFKALPVYARHIGAAEEILKLIYVEFYFGNFQLRTGSAA
jgi:hypothetical protein